MEKINDEQTKTTAQTAEAEEVLGDKVGEVSLGKFKDASALLNAYNSLQSEFTKRCQKIKELESKLESADKATAPTEQGEIAQPVQDTTVKDEEQVLKEYLLGVLGRKPTAIVMDGAGVGVKTPVARPKTLSEAGNLAKNLFNN